MPTETAVSRHADVRPRAETEKLHHVEPKALLIRFAFGAVVSVAAGIIAHLAGARLAGAFLAFPAILPASLTLIQDEEGRRRADRDAIGAVLGGIALVVFAAFGELAFGHLPGVVVLVIVASVWLAASLGLYAALAVLLPELCDRRQD